MLKHCSPHACWEGQSLGSLLTMTLTPHLTCLAPTFTLSC